MKIGNFDLDKDILIIAEIGNNHEGSYALAEEMIGLAAEAGASAVKFQTIVPDKLVSPRQEDRIEQLKKFCLSYQDFERLSQVAKQTGIVFLSTPFDIESVHFLEPLVPAYKVASGDNNFFPMIEAIAQTGKPIILSTGLADWNQINQTKTFIEDIWQKTDIQQELALLHCVVSYPTPPQEANLLAIQQLRKLNVTVGYSDHTMGIEAAIAAVALGARIIEKHFTIDKNYSSFRDHQLSADPQDLADLVRRVKQTVELLGNVNLSIDSTTAKNVRRSVIAGRDLESGTVLSWDDLNWVRPGGGLEPGREDEILGKKLLHPIQRGDFILLDDVDN
jgi:N-acetylneuraminate synthase/N,N'-diacetyllegionaminate synthase